MTQPANQIAAVPFYSDRASYTPIAVDCLGKVDSPLPYPLYLQVASSFVLLHERGKVLTSESLAAIAAKTEIVFLPKDHWGEFLRFHEERHFYLSPTLDPLAFAQSARRLLLFYWENVLQSYELYPNVFESFRKWLSALAVLLADASLAKQLIRQYRDSDLYFSNHNVNVSLYAMAMGYELGFPIEEIKILGLGALLHNVGNLAHPFELQYKAGDLTTEELHQLKMHPLRGAEILKGLKADPKIVMMTLQHHERCDGGGYPNQVLGKDIHFYAKICAVADVFDALLNGRTAAGVQSYEQAKAKLTAMKLTLDPEAMKALFALGY